MTAYPSQTALLQKYKIKVKGDLGQHLLLDSNIVRKIVAALNPQIDGTVVEIGPGLGALTVELLKHGMQVIAIEKDPKFAEVLEKELLPLYPDQLHILNEDVLKCDLSGLCEGLEPVQLVSNLPYYITTPIIFKLVEEKQVFSSAVLMMQREVAGKLTAPAGAFQYGRISAAVAAVGRVTRLFTVAKGCFTPAPAVDSTVVRLDFKPLKKLDLKDMPDFHQFIKTAFSERRKTLMALLLSQKGPKPARIEMEIIFKNSDLEPKVRADQLTAEQLAVLFLKIRQFMNVVK